MNFDFDEWVRLFRTDPEAAERRRQAEIEALISAVPPERQERLRRLQWHIDMVRERHKASPLGSCIAINRLLMEKVYGEDGFLDRLKMLSKVAVDQSAPLPAEPRKPFRLLPFSRSPK